MRLKALHLAVALVCALGLGIDLLEMSINNALAAVFSASPRTLSPTALSWLLACAYVGAVVGATAVGRIADRWGPRRTLVAVFLWMGVTSVLAATRSDPGWFAGFRLASGIALGACPPVLIAYLTGIAPARSRGMLIFWVSGLAYLMPPAGVFLLRALTPIRPLGIEGWRWPFFLAGLIALTVGIVFVRLPECYRWLAAAGQDRAASEVLQRFEKSSNLEWLKATTPSRAPERDPYPPAAASNSFARRLVLIIALYCLQPWAAVSFQLLTGPMLLQRGYALSDVLYYVALATFGPTLGALLAGLAVDRTERRISMVLAGVLMALAAWVFFSAEQRLLLATSPVLFAVGVAVYTPVMMTYGSELFAPSVRSTATGIAWSANRVSAVIVPLVMLPLFARHGFFIVGLAVFASLVLAAGLAAIAPLAVNNR